MFIYLLLLSVICLLPSILMFFFKVIGHIYHFILLGIDGQVFFALIELNKMLTKMFYACFVKDYYRALDIGCKGELKVFFFFVFYKRLLLNRVFIKYIKVCT